MLQKIVLITLLSFCFIFLNAQSEEASNPLDVSFEFQAYPTGLIPGLRIEKGFADKHAVHLRIGYQWIRHRDLGEHDDERGTGYGFTLGYRKYFGEGFKGFSLSSRCDLWFNELDWKDDTPAGEVNGTSKITVVQPTIEAGYTFEFGNQMIFTPTAAFGYEVNVKTDGADVGEGAILLIGFEIGKRF